MMQKHFVKFYSPGTCIAEMTSLEIDSWDVDKAKELSKTITERWNSHPYGFKFYTKGREDDELDSKIIKESGMYYINGTVNTLEEIKARNDPKDQILISNMEGNGWDRVVTTFTPWKYTRPFYDKDQIVTVL